MTDTPKTVFVTKYALENGIAEVVVVSAVGDLIRVNWSYPGPGSVIETFEAGDYTTTREAAVSRANAMRDAKLQALQQQAERVKGLRFE